jgi:hypothetical protein
MGPPVPRFAQLATELQRMAIAFLNAVQAAHVSFLDDDQVLDDLPQPTQRAARRVAGIDLNKPRMRSVTEAVIALAADPNGFTLAELAACTRRLNPQQSYTPRHAADDITKLRAKQIVARTDHTRAYRATISACAPWLGCSSCATKSSSRSSPVPAGPKWGAP